MGETKHVVAIDEQVPKSHLEGVYDGPSMWVTLLNWALIYIWVVNDKVCSQESEHGNDMCYDLVG